MLVLGITEVLRAPVVLVAISKLVALGHSAACQQVSVPSISLLSDHLLFCIDSVAPVAYHTASADKFTLGVGSPS